MSRVFSLLHVLQVVVGNVLHKIREEVIVVEQERERVVRVPMLTDGDVGKELEEELVFLLTELHSAHLTC